MAAERYLFHFPPQRRAAREFRKIPRIASGEFSIERFPNGELHLDLKTPVAGKRCLVLGTIAPPERNLASFLLLCHTLRSEGASHVTALLPYLAYSRHDRKEPGRSRGAAWAGALLGAAGVGAIVTIDVHSRRAARVVPMPLLSVSSAELFAAEIERRSLHDATIVAPDQGAVERCKAVARKAGMKRSVAVVTKTRTPQGVVLRRLRGNIGKRAIIVDDMLDTGGTLLACSRELRRRGAREIHVFVTHGLFTGDAWRKLWGMGVKSIACTDTVPVRSAQARKLTVLPAASLLVRSALEV